MNLAVITPCYFNEKHFGKVYSFFIDSCLKNSINYIKYGGEFDYYPGWVEIKIKGLSRVLDSLKDETHVLFTDGADVIFLSDIEEIKRKYIYYGSPDVFMSASKYPQGTALKDYMNITQFQTKTAFRYPHCGMYIAEINTLKKLLVKMLSYNYGDDAHSWYQMWHDNYFKPVLDINCSIFQVCSLENDTLLEDCVPADSRIFNFRTKTFPCMYHASGGYHDPEDGKLKIMKELYDKIQF